MENKNEFRLSKRKVRENEAILVEKHAIYRTHRFYKECDNLCRQAKDLYNVALNMITRHYDDTGESLGFFGLSSEMARLKVAEYYDFYSTKLARGVLRDLGEAFNDFFKALKDFEQRPWKYNGKKKLAKGEKITGPKPPQYKLKPWDRATLLVQRDAMSTADLRITEIPIKGPDGIKRIHKCSGVLTINGTNISIPLWRASLENIREARIVATQLNYYEICVSYVWNKDINPNLSKDRIASIDLGVSNLAAITSNVKDFMPVLVNGRPLKSINQYYSKKKAVLQANLPPDKKTSWEIKALTRGRNMLVRNYIHHSSRYIVDLLNSKNIGILIIGKNADWKQQVEMKKANNQNFEQIPHDMLIKQLKYKCNMKGICVILDEESYTSKCSFLDNEEVCEHEKYVGIRNRRLFYTKDGRYINADVNASANILRKYYPDAFAEGIEHIKRTPLKVTPNSHPTRTQTEKEKECISKYSKYNL